MLLGFKFSDKFFERDSNSSGINSVTPDVACAVLPGQKPFKIN